MLNMEIVTLVRTAHLRPWTVEFEETLITSRQPVYHTTCW